MVLGEQKAIVIKPNEAIKLRATRETVDRNGKMRVAGEEWMVKKNGAYLPGVYEEVVEKSTAYYFRFHCWENSEAEQQQY